MDMELDSEDFEGFEERSGMPCRSSRKLLEERGARYLSTPPFLLNGAKMVYEQMQFMTENRMYMWKRLVEADSSSDTSPFVIHVEVDERVGAIRYKTPKITSESLVQRVA